jgi:hypothetical protein
MRSVALCTLALMLGAADWQEYASKQGKYSVSFPEKPTEKMNKVGSLTVYTVSAESAGTLRFVVYYFDTGISEAQLKDAEAKEKMLDQGQQILTTTITGKLQNQKKITLDGNPGRQFDIGDAQGKVYGRVYLAGTSMYVLAAQSRGGKDVPMADTKKFFESFKISK